MTMRRLLAAAALAVLALLPGAPARAQFGEGAPKPDELVQVTATPVALGPGARGETTVRMTIGAGWHVNANPPALDYLIPTRVTIAPGFGVQARAPRYPAGQSLKLAFEDQPLLVYDGAAEIVVPLEAGAGAVNGEHVLKGTLQFQACNDQVCLAPARVPFEVRLAVTGGVDPGTAPAGDSMATAVAAPDSAPSAPDTTAPSGFTTSAPAGAVADAARSAALDNPVARALTAGGWSAYLTLFLVGLALNLTPCVYPMLGVTVSIFGARRKVPVLQVFGQALVYVLGICLMYSTLGVIAALTGGLFGAFLQNPIVLVAIGLLLLGLSLSMFGLYEFQMPTWLMDKVSGTNTASLAGTFVSGLVVGVFAAPCVGPPVVAVLAVIGAKADPVYGFLSLFTLAFGLGFPYLLLGTFSNLLQTMPRSGEWMDWVKKLFGVILASVGLSYALLGLAPSVAPWVVPAALVLGGLYLGFMEKSGNAMKAFRAVKRAGGLAAVAAGVWLSLQYVTAAGRSIAFQPYDEGKVAASLQRGRHVMLDFSADWCVPCHELELQTFTDARVAGAARESFDAYKVDLTSYDSPESEQWRRQYAIAGVPTIVFLAPGGNEVPGSRVEGFLPPERFLQRMRTAMSPAEQAAP